MTLHLLVRPGDDRPARPAGPQPADQRGERGEVSCHLTGVHVALDQFVAESEGG
eukprot:SAG22_NODE_613_length_8567_cov_4.215163_5_plen_54_part_00